MDPPKMPDNPAAPRALRGKKEPRSAFQNYYYYYFKIQVWQGQQDLPLKK